MARAMGQEPIDQLLGLGRLAAQTSSSAKAYRARSSAGDWLQGSDAVRPRRGAWPRRRGSASPSRSSSLGGRRLAVHLREGQGQVGQGRRRERWPLAIEPVGQGEIALPGRGQGVQQDGLALVVACRSRRHLVLQIAERPCCRRRRARCSRPSGPASGPRRCGSWRSDCSLPPGVPVQLQPPSSFCDETSRLIDRADAAVQGLGLGPAGLAAAAKQLLQAQRGHQVAGGRSSPEASRPTSNLAPRGRGQHDVQQAPLDRRADEDLQARPTPPACPRAARPRRSCRWWPSRWRRRRPACRRAAAAPIAGPRPRDRPARTIKLELSVIGRIVRIGRSSPASGSRLRVASGRFSSTLKRQLLQSLAPSRRSSSSPRRVRPPMVVLQRRPRSGPSRPRRCGR